MSAQEPFRPSRRLLWGAALGVLLGGVGIAVAVHSARAVPPPEPTITADTPHVDGKTIVFSQGFRERAGITGALVRRAPLKPVVKVVGAVTFDPEHVAAVGTRISGIVRRLTHLEGDVVKEGEILAEIESAELGSAQASVGMLKAQKRAAEINATRERDLADKRLSTAREAEVAEASLEEYRAMLTAAQQKVTALGGKAPGPLGVYRLQAPLSGTVVDRRILAGQTVESNLVAFRIADLDHLWIELDVFERNLGAIRKGDAVEVRPSGNADQAIMGHVAYVGDEIDLTTRSAVVRVKVDNKERKLRPGQSVTASLSASGPERNALLVPSASVAYVDGKPTVFVLVADDRVVATEVTLGASDDRDQEIVSGVAEGDRVVSGGVFAIKSELYR